MGAVTAEEHGIGSEDIRFLLPKTIVKACFRFARSATKNSARGNAMIIV